jgi:hypothetical protein
MEYLNRQEFLANYFTQRWYIWVDTTFHEPVKSLINVFTTEVKNAIARGNNIPDELWPDFAIVKSPEIFVQWFQWVKVLEDTRFSLWRILDDWDPFPFVCLKKDGKVMRTPQFRKNWGFWEAISKLLVR